MNWKIFDNSDVIHSNNRSVGRMSEGISPYVIPRAYRVFLDESNNILNLEFRYIAADSEILFEEVIKGVFIGYGKISKRIFSVSFDLSDVKGHMDLSKKFEDLKFELERKDKSHGNYRSDYGDRAILSRKEELIHELK